MLEDCWCDSASSTRLEWGRINGRLGGGFLLLFNRRRLFQGGRLSRRCLEPGVVMGSFHSEPGCLRSRIISLLALKWLNMLPYRFVPSICYRDGAVPPIAVALSNIEEAVEASSVFRASSTRATVRGGFQRPWRDG